MNPIIEKALFAIVRHVLAMLVPFFVANGIWTPDEATAYVAAAATALLMLSWSLYEKYVSQRLLVTSQAMAGKTTQAQVEAQVRTGNTPPVTLAKTDVPTLPKETR